MRASDRAYEELRDGIVGWELVPGTILGEVETAARLGVSRTPVREAFRRLHAEGLVQENAGRGIIVTAVSPEAVNDIFEVRYGVEPIAAAAAAERRDEALFRALQRDFERVPERLRTGSLSKAEYYALVRRFDDSVDASIHNDYLLGIVRNLRQRLVRVRRLAKDNPDRLLSAAQEHAVIIDAIADGESELARHATITHLHRAQQHTLNQLTHEREHNAVATTATSRISHT